MNKAELLTELAQRTGLTRNTVKDLLKQGWTYKEAIDQPSMFVQQPLRRRRNAR